MISEYGVSMCLACVSGVCVRACVRACWCMWCGAVWWVCGGWGHGSDVQHEGDLDDGAQVRGHGSWVRVMVSVFV